MFVLYKLIPNKNIWCGLPVFLFIFLHIAKVSRPTIACPTDNLIEGKTSVNLTCDADGVVSTRVWMKDGQPLVSGDRLRFYDGNRVLSINPVNRRDTGDFHCTVSNDLSFDTAGCQLNVYCEYFILPYIYTF